MRFPLLLCTLFFVFFSCKEGKKIEDLDTSTIVSSVPSSAPAITNPPPTELADSHYIAWGRERLKLFEAAEYDKWAEGFSEKVVVQWSGGDSLTGKKAVADYWKEKHATDIDTIQMANDSWLAIKVNQPQHERELPGVWLLSWVREEVKYKNRKSLRFWVHQKAHYNAASKIDRVVIYMDQAPINKLLQTEQGKTISGQGKL